MTDSNLFFTIMEAEGDMMQPFDDTPADTPSEDIAPPATPDAEDAGGADDSIPPDMGSDDSMDMSGADDSTGMDDMGMGDDTSDGSSDEEEADKKNDDLSEKANNIMNQQLYQKMVDRNSEINEIIQNIGLLVPLLPYDVVKNNDESLNQLKTALQKGQRYVINDFVNSGYGENLLFYKKLDSLYVLLLDQLNTNLKKIEKS